MDTLEAWMDDVLARTFPAMVVAIAFNLYEGIGNHWSIEFVGTDSFDPEDADWVCDEVFTTRDTPFTWKKECSWDKIVSDVSGIVIKYLETGKYAEKLKSYQGVGVGFVDGDLLIVYHNNKM